MTKRESPLEGPPPEENTVAAARYAGAVRRPDAAGDPDRRLRPGWFGVRCLVRAQFRLSRYSRWDHRPLRSAPHRSRPNPLGLKNTDIRRQFNKTLPSIYD